MLAFDVYGTLIDPHGLESILQPVFGPKARQASGLWREKQLEYSFRRALMRKYVSFDVCTAQALAFVGERLGTPVSEEQKRALLDRYLQLPAYPDVSAGLQALRERGRRLAAFSNGTEKSVRGLLEHSSILNSFEQIVSVDDVGTFKPDPAVYEYLVQRVKLPKDSIWVISSNPFDVIGAKAFGLRAAWIQRDSSRHFDPWEFEPDAVFHDVKDFAEKFDQLWRS
ncbi:MAG: haloacid dehalogenase type II [Bryobacteraceae bacterium]